MRRAARSSSPVRLSLVMDTCDVGGAEILLLNLFRCFDPAVVTPRLVCFKGVGALGPEFAAAGFPVEVIGRGGRYDLRTFGRLIRSFRRNHTDVVLVTHLHHAPLLIGRLAARMSGRRSVVAPHGMDTTTMGDGRCLPRHDVETLFLSDALVLVAPSQGRYLHEQEGVGRRPWNRIREVVIPNGIPLPPTSTACDRAHARRELGFDANDLVVGIVARLDPVKAHDILLDAIAKLVPSHPRLHLVCIGDGELKAELVALARSLDIADHVRFAGRRRDVARLLPAFDVACLTSRYECAPLAVIEAMAAGVPVVATDVGAVRDLVAQGVEGYLVDPGDSAALADRIARLAADEEIRTRMGAAGRARAERQFRIEDTARSFERLLTSLVGGR